MQRNPELDGLRGIAATGVVLFHWNPTYTFWMWSFVDLFFVLSGYLISRILMENWLAGSLSFRDFWIRRILRIWPVYYATFFAVFGFLALTRGIPYVLDTRLSDVTLSALFLQFTPLYFHSHGEVLAVYDFLPGFQHSWSLAVEEQFYLLWPLLLVFLLRHANMRMLAWCCIGLAMLGPLSRAWLELAPALLISRIEGLALGALLATLIVRQIRAGETGPHRLRTGGYLLALGAGLAGVSPYLLYAYTYEPSLYDLAQDPLLASCFTLVYFAVVGLAVDYQGTWWLKLLRSRLLTYLGGISYAIYMFHLPILVFLEPRIEHRLGDDLQWLTILITAACLVGFPHLSKIFLERPALALKTRLTSRYE